MQNEITYPFPNFNGCTVEVHRWSLGMDKLFLLTLYWACNYISMLFYFALFCYGYMVCSRWMLVVYQSLLFGVASLALGQWRPSNPEICAWWRHQLETFSALLAISAGNSPVPGEFPAQRPVTRSCDVFFGWGWGCVGVGWRWVD